MRRSLLLICSIGLSLSLVACGKDTVKREAVIGKDVVTTVMPTGPIVHPVHGKEIWFGVGAMGGAEKVKANGVAQTHVFEDANSIVDVRVNIEVPPAGTRYVAWVRQEGSTEYVEVGEMHSPTKDVRFAVNTTLKQDLRDMTSVAVTKESSTGKPTRKVIVATGTLKEQRRPQ
jgi:hypothetical protein